MSNILYYNSQDVMAEYDTYYAEGYRAFGQLYPEMAQDLRLYLGDQWSNEERNALKEEGRKFYTINKTKSKIDWIDGYQIQNRLSSVALPIQDASQETADDITKLILYVLDKYNGYNYISETFSAGNKTGWSLLNVYLNYHEDPVNGDINFGRDPYSGFICDPYFTKIHDLADCSWLMKRKYLPPSLAITLLPGQEEEVQHLARDGWERDNKFTWMTFQRVPTGQRMMSYNEFFRQKFKPQKVIVNKMTKQFVDWNGSPDDFLQVKQAADAMGHEIEIITRNKRFIEKHIIINNTYMRTEINPYSIDEYPFALYAPIFEPESEDYTSKVQSLIRQLRDPQRELNRRRSQIIDIVESQLNSGWIEEDGAVKNPKMLYQSGQGRRIVLNAGYKRDSIDRIQPAVVPANFFQETQQDEADLMEILGMNPTIFGHVETKQVSALVEMQRQKAGLMAQEPLFNALVEFQRSISTKIMKIVQQWSPDKVKQILGKEPTQEFFDKNFSKYHISVAEGINTPTQKYMYFRQLMDLKALEEPIPPGELTKAAPLQGKSDFLRAMEEFNKQQQQMQAQAAQSAQVQEQSMAQALQAKAVADIALSKERQARAIADLGLQEERNAEAIKNREEAAFTHLKSLQEMEHLETDHSAAKDKRLMDMIAFFQQYEAYLKGQQEQTGAEQEKTVATIPNGGQNG